MGLGFRLKLVPFLLGEKIYPPQAISYSPNAVHMPSLFLAAHDYGARARQENSSCEQAIVNSHSVIDNS